MMAVLWKKDEVEEVEEVVRFYVVWLLAAR